MEVRFPIDYSRPRRDRSNVCAFVRVVRGASPGERCLSAAPRNQEETGPRFLWKWGYLQQLLLQLQHEVLWERRRVLRGHSDGDAD